MRDARQYADQETIGILGQRRQEQSQHGYCQSLERCFRRHLKAMHFGERLKQSIDGLEVQCRPWLIFFGILRLVESVLSLVSRQQIFFT